MAHLYTLILLTAHYKPSLIVFSWAAWLCYANMWIRVRQKEVWSWIPPEIQGERMHIWQWITYGRGRQKAWLTTLLIIHQSNVSSSWSSEMWQSSVPFPYIMENTYEWIQQNIFVVVLLTMFCTAAAKTSTEDFGSSLVKFCLVWGAKKIKEAHPFLPQSQYNSLKCIFRCIRWGRRQQSGVCVCSECCHLEKGLKWPSLLD